MLISNRLSVAYAYDPVSVSQIYSLLIYKIKCSLQTTAYQLQISHPLEFTPFKGSTHRLDVSSTTTRTECIQNTSAVAVVDDGQNGHTWRARVMAHQMAGPVTVRQQTCHHPDDAAYLQTVPCKIKELQDSTGTENVTGLISLRGFRVVFVAASLPLWSGVLVESEKQEWLPATYNQILTRTYRLLLW